MEGNERQFSLDRDIVKRETIKLNIAVLVVEGEVVLRREKIDIEDYPTTKFSD